MFVSKHNKAGVGGRGGKGSLVVNMFCIRLLHIFLFLQKCVSLVTFALLCVAMQNTLMQGLDGGMG